VFVYGSGLLITPNACKFFHGRSNAATNKLQFTKNVLPTIEVFTGNLSKASSDANLSVSSILAKVCVANDLHTLVHDPNSYVGQCNAFVDSGDLFCKQKGGHQQCLHLQARRGSQHCPAVVQASCVTSRSLSATEEGIQANKEMHEK
jgi:hypothetical protein